LRSHTGSRRLLLRQRHIAVVRAVGAGSRAREHRTDAKCGSPGCARHHRVCPGLRRCVHTGAVRSGQDTTRDRRQDQRRYHYRAGRSGDQSQAGGNGLRGCGFFARGAGKAAQVGNRPMERTHQVSGHHTRLIVSAQSALMFASRITRPNSLYCLLKRAAKSAPHIQAGWRLWATSFALTSGICIAAANQPASSETVSFGVFAGANKPFQLSASKPLKPDSATVGTLGSDSLLLREALASARTVPAFSCAATPEEGKKTAVTCPPSSALTAGASPGY